MIPYEESLRWARSTMRDQHRGASAVQVDDLARAHVDGVAAARGGKVEPDFFRKEFSKVRESRIREKMQELYEKKIRTFTLAQDKAVEQLRRTDKGKKMREHELVAAAQKSLNAHLFAVPSQAELRTQALDHLASTAPWLFLGAETEAARPRAPRQRTAARMADEDTTEPDDPQFAKLIAWGREVLGKPDAPFGDVIEELIARKEQIGAALGVDTAPEDGPPVDPTPENSVQNYGTYERGMRAAPPNAPKHLATAYKESLLRVDGTPDGVWTWLRADGAEYPAAARDALNASEIARPIYSGSNTDAAVGWAHVAELRDGTLHVHAELLPEIEREVSRGRLAYLLPMGEAAWQLTNERPPTRQAGARTAARAARSAWHRGAL